MHFKGISYLELWRRFCSAELNHWCNFSRGYQEEQLCEIILNLDQWVRRYRLKIFLVWSSGGAFVQQSRTICAILAEGIKRNNSMIFFFNLDQWFRRCRLKDFLSGALAALLFSGADPFMQMLKEGIMGSYMKFGPVVQEMSFKEKVYGRQTQTDHHTSP